VHVASPFGIPVRLHWSFLVLAGGLLLFGAYLGRFVPTAFGVASLIVSVVLHELGHALAARRYGIGTDNITLYPMGGIASIERMPEEPDQEIAIALAGPAVNFALAALGGLVWSFSTSEFALLFVISNVLMGLFNLIPAFPMDGGRVLRAVLARYMGFLPASRLAIQIGRVFAVLFIGAGLWQGIISLVLVGGFLLMALQQEKERLVQLNWERSTGRPPPWVAGAAWYVHPGILPR
jgi:Zn-dependent protease